MRWWRVCALFGAMACSSNGAPPGYSGSPGPAPSGSNNGRAKSTVASECLQGPKQAAKLAEEPERDFGRADTAYRIGVELATSGDHAAAQEAFERAVRADPMHGLAHLALADTHLYTDNDQSKMHQHLAAAVVLLPENPRAQLKYAELESDRDNAEAAIRHWQCALALKPGLADAHYGLARVFLRTAKPAAAEKEVRAAIATDTKNVRFQMLLADVLEAKGEPLGAAKAAEAAAEIVESSAALYRRAGTLYAAAGDEDAASRVRRVADRIDPPAEERDLRPLRKARKKRKRRRRRHK